MTNQPPVQTRQSQGAPLRNNDDTRRCLGRTIRGHRCRLPAGRLFCPLHRRQPWTFAFAAISFFGLVLGLATDTWSALGIIQESSGADEAVETDSDVQLAVSYWFGPPSDRLEDCITEAYFYVSGQREHCSSLIPPEYSEFGLLDDGDRWGLVELDEAVLGSFRCSSNICREDYGLNEASTTNIYLAINNEGQTVAKDVVLTWSEGETQPVESRRPSEILSLQSPSPTMERIGDLAKGEGLLIPIATAAFWPTTSDTPRAVVPIGFARVPISAEFNLAVGGRSHQDLRQPADAMRLQDNGTNWTGTGG